MPVKMLSEQDKTDVVVGFTKFNMPPTVLADQYGCSATTINRVLRERSAVPVKPAKPPPVNAEETKKVMSLLYRYGISYDQLEALLNHPAMTAQNVAKFLRDANPPQLAIILTAAGLVQTLPTIPIPKAAQQPLF